jgi:hypothetical protein
MGLVLKLNLGTLMFLAAVPCGDFMRRKPGTFNVPGSPVQNSRQLLYSAAEVPTEVQRQELHCQQQDINPQNDSPKDIKL